jgi:hypothetical protein
MAKQFKLNVKGTEINLIQRNEQDFISLTDMVKPFGDDILIYQWMRGRNAVEFLGIWEQLHNPNFKGIEFDTFKMQSGLNSFSLTPRKWISQTNAIGIFSKSGRYGGGTFAHKDIAFEFGSWLSPEFKLYLIKEFQRLKDQENKLNGLDWDLKRNLAKINYKIHTDSIKENLIPQKINPNEIKNIYANEADVLNKALFNTTAKEWREQNPKQEGNIRDYASAEQLVVLSNLESLNAEFIMQKLSQSQRLIRLNEIAIYQMESIVRPSTEAKLLK